MPRLVSRETNAHLLLTPDFVGGIASIAGTFFHTQSARVEQFGFQIKTPAENKQLLDMVRRTMGLRSPVHIYKEGSTNYALLITRSQRELRTKVIPYLSERLYGVKLKQFLVWQEKLAKHQE